MSLDAMNHVFKRKYGSASQKLMMLAIADRCDDDGVCYAGLKWFQAKHNQISRRTAEKLIASLEESGDLVVIVHNGIETKSGKTNRYYLKTFRDDKGLSTPKPGTRADQLEESSDWQRPVKSDGGSESDRPVNDDGGDPSNTTGHDPSNATGDSFLDTSVDSIPLSKDNGGDDPALPEIKDDVDGDPEKPALTVQQKTTRYLGIYWSRLFRVAKDETGFAPAINQGEWRRENYDKFKAIAEHELDIQPGEFAAYLDFLLASDWYTRNKKLPAISTIGKKIALHVVKKRDTVEQVNNQSSNESSWSNLVD